MLNISKLVVAYGQATILQGVDFNVKQGEVLALLGRNGAGKSTTLKSIMGLVRPVSGTIEFSGGNIAGSEPYQIARKGIGYVPEERRIFAELTVMENLEIGRQAARNGHAWTEDELFEIFPNLGRMRTRRGGAMSGGEQQMLTIARTLMGNPRLVLLDEPSEGLSPLIVEQMAEAIQVLKKRGITVLLAEQNLYFAEYLADQTMIMEKGRIVWSGGIGDLMADAGLQERYLAV